MKIIQVCGTMGSGKTTTVRELMTRFSVVPVLGDGGRSAPWGYLDEDAHLFVPGSYDVATASGCDTIKDIEAVFNLIRARHAAGYHVVYEGLFTPNHTRGIELFNQTRELQVLRLTTSLEDCHKGVLDRRARQGNEEPLPERFFKGLQDHDKRNTNYCFKLRQIGCPIHRVSRDEAVPKILELLGAG